MLLLDDNQYVGYISWYPRLASQRYRLQSLALVRDTGYSQWLWGVSEIQVTVSGSGESQRYRLQSVALGSLRDIGYSQWLWGSQRYRLQSVALGSLRDIGYSQWLWGVSEIQVTVSGSGQRYRLQSVALGGLGFSIISLPQDTAAAAASGPWQRAAPSTRRGGPGSDSGYHGNGRGLRVRVLTPLAQWSSQGATMTYNAALGQTDGRLLLMILLKWQPSYINEVLYHYGPTVYDAGPTIIQYWCDHCLMLASW